MTEKADRPTTETTTTPDRDAIERLLRLAGPRPGVPPEAEERVRSRVYAQWREQTRGRSRRLYVWGGVGLAAAAGLVFALMTVPTVQTVAPSAATAVAVASLQSVSGEVYEIIADGQRRPLGRGDVLRAGMTIETSRQARAGLDMRQGGSLRLDHSTHLRLLDGDSIVLEGGRIYFDSGDDAKVATTDPAIEVETALGVVRDIGTQFEVRHGEELGIRVRDGLIHLDQVGATHEAGAGVELRVSAAGTLSRHDAPLFGPSWDWILDVSTPFELEGRTLASFLAWVSRETGWQTEFVDATLADSALEVVLHGSIEGLRPDRALEAVLPTCGLIHRFDGGVLLIEAESR